MLLPTTATAVWAALILSLICWGSWAVLFKAAKKARFEFFAYDFTLGVVLASIVAAFTLGSWDNRELTFQDNFVLIGVRKMIVAIAAGLAFGMANATLLGSIAISGMVLSFPVAFSIAWAILAVWVVTTQPSVNSLLSIGGAVTALIAAILSGIAYSWYVSSQKAIEALTDPRKSAPPGRTAKAIALAVLSGICFAGFFLLLARATSSESGLAPYGAALVVSAGIFAINLLILPVFLNFPLKGQPLRVSRYFKIEKRHHILGILAGVIWAAGLLSGLTADNLPTDIQVSPLTAYMVSRSIPIIAMFWGLFVWREMSGAPARVNAMMAAVFVLLMVGMGMIGVAPVYGR